MTRNILDLTKKVSISSNTLFASQTSSKNISDFEVESTSSIQNRTRKPLPIIEPRTGKEVLLESDPFQPNYDRNLNNTPPVNGFQSKSIPQNNATSPTKNLRKPLPIINPKTGEIVTNPESLSTQKCAIPIINPKTGTKIENIQSEPSSNRNIIRTPFMVMVNRPLIKKAPYSLHASYPMHNAQIPLPPSIYQKNTNQVVENPSTIWSKSRQPHEWPMCLTSYSDRFSFQQEIEEEEEESEVDKYDWTHCYKMSIFDNEESVCADQRGMGLNDKQVSVW